MDFFEAQARAKKRTSRLVFLFVLAVLGTIVAMYFASLLIISQTQGSTRRDEYGYVEPRAELSLWQPGLLAGVTAATVAIVGLGSLFKWSQFSAGGRAVADSVGGRRIDPGTRDPQERRLLNVVEEMAIASGVPVPAVYIMDEEPGINAFAAGLTTNDAVVAVTRGTLEKLNRDELQGVVAHEFSHILNGDMRLNLRIAAIIFGILVLGIIGRGVLWHMRHVRVRSRDSKNSGGIVAVIFMVGLALLIIGYVGYFFGRLIQAAVSRQREFLADASSVQFTRNPGGISGALKKIGGFALGSTVQSNQSAALGHFFFAQAFRSGFSGLWATHPPLDERIRAIDPSFDGKFFEPPEVVDVRRESFVTAGLATPPVLREVRPQPSAAVAAIGAIGTLTAAQIVNAQQILDTTPAGLREAAHEPTGAMALLFGLLLASEEPLRSSQCARLAQQCDAATLQNLERLKEPLRALRDEHRLPLLQVALPALRQIPENQLETFLDSLDELVHADEQVTAFEYAMQRLIRHGLAIGQTPGKSVAQIYSFNAVVNEITVVLSVLARASTTDAAQAPRAFAAGASQLKLIEKSLSYLDDSIVGLGDFDTALDKLATASLPIKQRTLIAAAHVVQADGQVRICEFELLRAIAAALDVPMPPLQAAA